MKMKPALWGVLVVFLWAGVAAAQDLNTATGYGALANNTTGLKNTANGYDTLYANTAGNCNTANGAYALGYNTTGSWNSANGYSALNQNTTGNYNTANGYASLEANTTGSSNTANGLASLYLNTTGSYNVANGVSALYANTTGVYNTAAGYSALCSNTTGTSNTGTGLQALYSNSTGGYNVAAGMNALYSNTSGGGNTATGYGALYANVSGSGNTAVGAGALGSAIGYHNTALGNEAGDYQGPTTGSNNIYVGNGVSPQVSDESDTTRIGNGQTAAYIAGIYGAVSSGGIPVYVEPDGHLGTILSASRYKEDIRDMGGRSEGIMRLRPVIFYYKPQYAPGPRILQYGLIAEEVAKVYPGLVQYDPKTGKPQTVYYRMLNSLLLNEVQKQHKKLEALAEEVSALKEQNRQVLALKHQIEELSAMVERSQGASGRLFNLHAAFDN